MGVKLIACRTWPGHGTAPVKEILRSNDVVLLSFVDALLNEAGIGHVVVDAHMSIVEGSVGILPRRIMVATEDWAPARRVLDQAGLQHVLLEG